MCGHNQSHTYTRTHAHARTHTHCKKEIPYHSEAEVQGAECPSEGAVVLLDRLALHHVDDEVGEDDEAKGSLPIAGGEDPMHAELYTQNYEQE